MRYDYSVVRFVPDTFKAEFVNVGLVVGNAETGEWKTRRVANASRARALRNGAELAAVWAYLDELDERVADSDNDVPTSPVPGPGWLRAEHDRLQNLVQLSRPQPVSAGSVDEAMAFLWDRMVVDPVRQTHATTRPSKDALRRAYLDARIDEKLIHEDAHARLGRQDARVDFVIANGHVAQIAHAFTFRRPSPTETVRKIKEWSWTIRDVRERDGHIVLGSTEDEGQTVDGTVPIDVVHDEPETDDGKRALDEAIEVLEHLEVTPRRIEDVELVARNAAEQLSRHHQASRS